MALFLASRQCGVRAAKSAAADQRMAEKTVNLTVYSAIRITHFNEFVSDTRNIRRNRVLDVGNAKQTATGLTYWPLLDLLSKIH